MRKRITRRIDHVTGGYDPRLVITVEGLDDVYRLARHLEQGQVEFVRLGHAILRSMDRQAPGVVESLTRTMGPSRLEGRYHGRKRRQVQLRLGMPEAELRELEEAVR